MEWECERERERKKCVSNGGVNAQRWCMIELDHHHHLEEKSSWHNCRERWMLHFKCTWTWCGGALALRALSPPPHDLSRWGRIGTPQRFQSVLWPRAGQGVVGSPSSFSISFRDASFCSLALARRALSCRSKTNKVSGTGTERRFPAWNFVDAGKQLVNYDYTLLFKLFPSNLWQNLDKLNFCVQTHICTINLAK